MNNTMKAYELLCNILRMLDYDNKRALNTQTAREAVKLVSPLYDLLPADHHEFKFCLMQIASAMESLGSTEGTVLPDDAKEALIMAFTNLKQLMADHLFEALSVTEFELTDANYSVLRSIAAMHLVNEEVD